MLIADYSFTVSYKRFLSHPLVSQATLETLLGAKPDTFNSFQFSPLHSLILSVKALPRHSDSLDFTLPCYSTVAHLHPSRFFPRREKRKSVLNRLGSVLNKLGSLLNRFTSDLNRLDSHLNRLAPLPISQLLCICKFPLPAPHARSPMRSNLHIPTQKKSPCNRASLSAFFSTGKTLRYTGSNPSSSLFFYVHLFINLMGKKKSAHSG